MGPAEMIRMPLTGFERGLEPVPASLFDVELLPERSGVADRHTGERQLTRSAREPDPLPRGADGAAVECHQSAEQARASLARDQVQIFEHAHLSVTLRERTHEHSLSAAGRAGHDGEVTLFHDGGELLELFLSSDHFISDERVLSAGHGVVNLSLRSME
jgi:hypothetical protein